MSESVLDLSERTSGIAGIGGARARGRTGWWPRSGRSDAGEVATDALPTWTLRGLDRRSRWIALLVAALVALPYLAAMLSARSRGWMPSGDAGMIGLFARDVLHGHPPLLATPTTADLASNGPQVHHPGPLQFYALALPMQLFGSTAGMLLWTVVANLASVLVAIWVVFRRCGPGIGLWAAVVLAGVAWSQGLPLIVDPINSDAGAIALAALALLAWGVACGDRRLLPLLALWTASYSQMHLGNLPLGVALAGWAVVVLIVRSVADRRRRRRARVAVPAPGEEPMWSGPDSDGGGRSGVPVASGGRWWPWWVGAVAVTLLAWAPVIIDAVAGDPSNLRQIWEYSRQGNRNTLGWASGVRQAAHALDPRAIVMRNGLDFGDLLRRLSTIDILLVFAVVVGLVNIAVRWRRRSPSIALLAATSLVFAALGAFVGAQVPRLQVNRFGFYRWTYMVSAMAMIAVGAAVIDLVRRASWARQDRLRPVACTAGIVLVAVLSMAASFVAAPEHGREDAVWGMERRVSDAVLPAVEGKKNVYVVPYGTLASRSLAMPLALDLESHGHHVSVPKFEVANYGKHRSPRRAKPDAVVVLAGSTGPAPPFPGQFLVRASTDQVSLNASSLLLDQAQSGPVVVSPKGDRMAEEAGLDPGALRLWIAGLTKEPTARLRDESTLRLLAKGYLTSPYLDPDAIETVLERERPTLWGQDTVQVVLMTPEQFEAGYGRMT